MTDYDIDKVSPRPWQRLPVDLTLFYKIRPDGTGLLSQIAEPIACSDGGDADWKHAVHCVNLVERLRGLCEGGKSKFLYAENPLDAALGTAFDLMTDALSGDLGPLERLVGGGGDG